MDCFSIEEVLRLLAAAKEQNELDWLLLWVTFICILRSHEAVGLKADNIVGNYLVVKRGKKSKPVRHELKDHPNPLLDGRKPLIELAARTAPNQTLFKICERTFQRRVHKYGKAAGLEELLSHPHTLKHSILTHLGQSMTLWELKEKSGHRSANSLLVYLHNKPGVVDEKFRRALDV